VIKARLALHHELLSKHAPDGYAEEDWEGDSVHHVVPAEMEKVEALPPVEVLPAGHEGDGGDLEKADYPRGDRAWRAGRLP